MVSASEVVWIIPSHLRPARKRTDLLHAILPTLPQQTTILVALEVLVSKVFAGRNGDISSRPQCIGRSILAGIEQHGTIDVPIAKLCDVADNIDLVAPNGRFGDREGKRDLASMRASRRGRCDRQAETGEAVWCHTVAMGMLFILHVGGIDLAGVIGGAVGDVERIGLSDDLGRFAVSETGCEHSALPLREVNGTHSVWVKFCFTWTEKLPMLK